MGAKPTKPVAVSGGAELPEAYGTSRVFLTPRDPHWLYANWDLTREQQAQHNAKSEDGHLVLRVHAEGASAEPVAEVHVHPESKHWFVHVEQPEQPYVVELGYYNRRHRWARVAVSPPAVTPRSRVAGGGEVRFATLPMDLPLPQAIMPPPQTAPPLSSETSVPPCGENELDPSTPSVIALPEWSDAQDAALVEALSFQFVADQPAPGARETTPPSSLALVDSVWPASSSPLGPFGHESESLKSFWFSVGAELMVYGATEPGASVTLGGIPVSVAPDGTFSARFALPDGTYEISAVAMSADGSEARAVQLTFHRETVEVRETDDGMANAEMSLPDPAN